MTDEVTLEQNNASEYDTSVLIAEIHALSTLLTAPVSTKLSEKHSVIFQLDNKHWAESCAFLAELEHSNAPFDNVDETIEKWHVEAKQQIPKLTGNQRVQLLKDAGKIKPVSTPKKIEPGERSAKKPAKPRVVQSTKTRQVRAPKPYDELMDDGTISDSCESWSTDVDFTCRLQNYNPRPLTSEAEAAASLRRMDTKFLKAYRSLLRKFLSKTARQRAQYRRDRILLSRKSTRECVKLMRQKALASQKLAKDFTGRGRRLAREVAGNWHLRPELSSDVVYSTKKKVQVAKADIDLSKYGIKEDSLSISSSVMTAAAKRRAEKQASEQRRADLELLEARRQQRKLDFLLTQTELYAHFMAKKMDVPDEVDEALLRPPETEEAKSKEAALAVAADKAAKRLGLIGGDPFDSDEVKRKALAKVQHAVSVERGRLLEFGQTGEASAEEAGSGLLVPGMFHGDLKCYQLKGLSWLLSLFDQGINGILADEMGLGKTIQTIAFLASLAEKYNMWGPFLIITPASTLHNWTQEFAKFTPKLKLIPYWGGPGERKVLRRFWSNINDPRKLIGTRDAEFHVVVTSYQVVLQDAKFINKTAWAYLVLDEAHAIKSIASLRWNVLLSFKCRNRLLLTGTPIQNTMQELWALLHFIMPSLFDSHSEFSAWFSKDIESQAAGSSQTWTTSRLDEEQLSRLHLVLKPFMLRRVKTEVQHEIAKKTEVLVHCGLSVRQRSMYDLMRKKIRIEDLNVQSAQSVSSAASSQLMNLVMQLRKICNHPDLIEPREANFPFLANLSHGSHEPVLLGQVHSTYHHKAHFHRRLPLLLCASLEARQSLISRLFSVELPLAKLRSTRRLDDLLLTELEATWVPNRRFSLRLGPSKPRLSFSCEDLVFTPRGIHSWSMQECREQPLQAVNLPAFLFEAYLPRSLAAPTRLFVSRPNGTQLLAAPILHQLAVRERRTGFRSVYLVPRSKLRTDSGKLVALDQLLTRLKSEGHRVLIYSQMTRMIDLLEEALQVRGHKYLRLDGSSRLSDRRDMVNQWQTNDAWFVFLLSTRAGGLGINLTAADTVIFYDSDWNPTVDQQAMDRAHRLGQTKPVTVYRLVCKNTIEQRMLQRAQEKRNMQHLVIQDGSNKDAASMRSLVAASGSDSTAALTASKPEQISSSEVVSMLLGDEESTSPALPLPPSSSSSYLMPPQMESATDSLERKRSSAWSNMPRMHSRAKKPRIPPTE